MFNPDLIQLAPLTLLAVGFVAARVQERNTDGYFPRRLAFLVSGCALIAAVLGVIAEGGARATTRSVIGSFFSQAGSGYPMVLEFAGGSFFVLASLLVLLAGVFFCASAPLVRVRLSRVFLMQAALLGVITTHSVVVLLLIAAVMLIMLISSVRYHAKSLYGDELAEIRAHAFSKYQGLALAALGVSLALRVAASVGVLPPGATTLQIDLISLTVAAAVIMGLFPFHGWVVPFLGSPRTSIFLPMFAVQLALVMFLRVYAPIAAHMTSWETVLLTCAVIGLLYASLLFFGEQRLKRIPGYLYMSHISLMAMTVAGLKEVGIASSLDAVNVLLAILGLLGVCSVLTSRFGVRGVKVPTGLGAFFPELAVCYLICVLSLVGFPGTLGFIEEEVMMGEGIGHHNLLVGIFAVALTLNGFSSFRLFARVFYGQPHLGRDPETALLPRERLILYCIIALIVLNGIAPSYVVDSCIPFVVLTCQRARGCVNEPVSSKLHIVYGISAALLTAGITTAFCISTEVSLGMAFLLGVNMAALFLMGLDRSLARSNDLRIPEVIFFVLALGGATPGTLLGIHVFRHKVRKAGFQFVLLLIFVAQLTVAHLCGVTLR